MRRSPHLQLALRLPKPRCGHGGARAGAGRKNRSHTLAHGRRPRLDPRHPVHVTLKLVEGLPSLRNKEVFRCLRRAVATARRRDLRIIHFAILSNHVHLLVEPTGGSLGKEMQSFALSLARRINGHLKRGGTVFLGSYHLRALGTPTEVKRVLAYILGNDTRHRGAREIRIDPFSSALAFGEWKRLYGKPPRLLATAWPDSFIEAWHAEILSPARTWLLMQGWYRAQA